MFRRERECLGERGRMFGRERECLEEGQGVQRRDRVFRGGTGCSEEGQGVQRRDEMSGAKDCRRAADNSGAGGRRKMSCMLIYHHFISL